MGRNATDLPFPKVPDAPVDLEQERRRDRPSLPLTPRVSHRSRMMRKGGDSDDEEPFPEDGKYLLDESNVCLESLTCLFGGTGAPGEWMVNAYAGTQYHERGYPAEPIWHTPFGFHSCYLMDDEILMEPLAGLRAWLSRRRARLAP